jgi:Fur family ferric uptake transcriptional regulator
MMVSMYKNIIKEKGLSVTDKRISILETLHLKNEPMTIEINASMDTSTIYRSLKKMVDHGIIYQTDFREGMSYFEFQGDHHHHHIVCTHCKSRESIDMCVNNDFLKIQKETGYTITNHIFELFGLCKNCTS